MHNCGITFCSLNCPTYGFQIGIVIEDRELVDSYMDAKPWKAGKFSLTLRLSLWSEHLGLRAAEVSDFPFSGVWRAVVSCAWFVVIILISFPQVNQIMDPVVASTYKDIWMGTAKVIRKNEMFMYILLIWPVNNSVALSDTFL